MTARLRRAPIVLCLTLAAGLLLCLPAAATPAWRQITVPWTDDVAVRSLSAFAPTGLAAIGGTARVAVSEDGGVTWQRRDVAGLGESDALRGVAFRDSAQGVVCGLDGTLLVTSDGGVSWRDVGFSGLRPSTDLYDVALRGDRGYACGADGTLLATTDGGETWSLVSTPVTADLKSVAVAGDGTLIAGATTGAVIVGSGSTAVTVAGQGTGPIVAVAAAPAPVSGDGLPDLAAATATEVLAGEGDALTALAVAPAASPRTALAWPGLPDGTLALAEAGGGVAFYATGTAATTASSTGMAALTQAAAPGSQSVTYAGGADGTLVRTLSAGRAPAALSGVVRDIKAGETAVLSAAVDIAAPGMLVLQQRVHGGRWRQAQAYEWTAAGWESALSPEPRPLFTSDYRLRFLYGGKGQVVSGTTTVLVRPRLTPDSLTISVSRGGTYRFRGTAYPALPGERVRLYTDRGGHWRLFTQGSSVRLIDGRRWVSRLLGTPLRETYHLKARIAATTRHGAAWSSVATVTVR